MDAVGRRFLYWLGILALFALTGTAHRLWVRHWVARAEASAGSEALEFREQARRIREQYDRLPPEGKSVVREVLKAQHGELVATPILLKLGRMAPSRDPAATLEERVLAGARAVGQAWLVFERWLVRLLWLGGLGLVAFGIAGIALDRSDWLSFAARCCQLAADLWLLWLAIGSALVFAVLGHNPWRGMPYSFYAVPGAVLLAGFMFRLQERRPTELAVPEALRSLGPPCASLLLVAMLRLVA